MSPIPAIGRLERLRHRLQRGFRYRGALVIVLWQVPLGPGIAPDGSVSLLFGVGMDELATLNCAGDVLEARNVSYRTAAVQADYNLTPLVRLDATAGLMSSGAFERNGAFAAAQLRLDGGNFGIGAGLGSGPTEHGSATIPVAHARLGPKERLHLRADLFPPSPLVTQQAFRLGLGYNATRRDAPSGFLGVAALGGAWLEADDGGIGAAGDIAVPINDRLGVRVNGHFGVGHKLTITGLAAGVNYRLR